MKDTTYTVSTATLTEAELFRHLLNSPMNQHESISTLLQSGASDYDASDYNVIAILPMCCESTLLEYDIAETFATALMSCEEDPTFEMQAIIWFLEELLDGIRAIQKDFEILKENTRTEASIQPAIQVEAL